MPNTVKVYCSYWIFKQATFNDNDDWLNVCTGGSGLKSILCFSLSPSPLFQGKMHSWVPHHVAEAKSPCALTCRAVNSSGPLVVQLAARVHDGTRCKPGSLDMCVDGTCQVKRNQIFLWKREMHITNRNRIIALIQLLFQNWIPICLFLFLVIREDWF